MLKEFDDKKILILGIAREGIDTLNFLFKLYPKRSFGISDCLSIDKLAVGARNIIHKHQSNLNLFLGDNYLRAINKYDIIIKSPGIPLSKIAPYLKPTQIVTSQMKIFFDHCPGKIIGITGTKGKSTTTSLIYAVLKKGGARAHILGNIGNPALSSLLTATINDVYVCELSCHQLSDLSKSPHIAVFLNIYPEHLDYYGNYEAYQNAKANICRYQNKNDYLIYNPDNAIVKRLAKLSSAQKILLDPKNIKRYINPNNILLKGVFNYLNIDSAIKVGELYGISRFAIKNAIQDFKPLLHRLEFVGKYQGIDFYNDSLATIPEATISAINTFNSKIGTLITGGFDRGVAYDNLAKIIINSKIKNIAFFPTTGKIIWEKMEKLNHTHRQFNVCFTNNMKDAVSFGYNNTKKGMICLLSCASASYNLFKDYRARGNAFKKYVKNR